MTRDDKIVDFPVTAEERARRLRAEVERLSRLPAVEWMYYVESEGYAERYDVDNAALKRMVQAAIKEAEKKQRAELAERGRIEARAEKQACLLYTSDAADE